MSLTEDLRGITPPLVTPFRQDGAIDHDALGRVVDRAVDGNVTALFPNGTTGEFASLTAAERAAAVETTVAHADGRPVIAGVANTALEDVLAGADRAADAGADAVVATAPYFHGTDNDAGVRAFLERVADESPLPVLLYDIPGCTGAPLSRETVVALAAHPNVLGLKDSSGDLTRVCALARETPAEFVLLQGADAILYPSLKAGIDGGINALSNVAPARYAALYDAVAAGDDAAARAVHEEIGPLFDLCATNGFAASTKAALAALGVLDDPTVRPPATPVDPDVVAAEAERLVGN